MNLKPILSVSLGAACAVAIVPGARIAAPAIAATPPPTPPPMSTPASPPPSEATPFPLPSGFATPAVQTPAEHVPSPTPSPPAHARKGIEGVWEVQIQHPNVTDYTHFNLLSQDGATLAGVYLDSAGKKYPLAGSIDGQQVRLIVSMPNGTTLLMEARLDGNSDMVGTLTTPTEQIPFTAAYRPKTKWIENVNPAPGGVGGMGAPGSPGGGPYTPPKRFST
ncbi:MAG TPA: hypothetical protein VMF61_03080 [Candidatus Acidoferrales bacterium]|nr:hypothetical protein [Candidatus Acidoferrales bacterium]